MKFKLLLYFFSILFLFSDVYSAVNVSTCQQINDSILDSDRIVYLNESIINRPTAIGNCFEIRANNMIFDCNNNLIDSINDWQSGIGIDLYSRNNVTVQNCKISEMGNGVMARFTINSFFYNISVNSSNYQAFTLSSSSHNNFVSNLTVIGNYNYVPFQIIRFSHNNTVVDSFFNSSRSVNVAFNDDSGGAPKNNTVRNSFIKNTSSVFFSAATENMNNSLTNNVYGGFNLSNPQPVCFQYGGCDYFPNGLNLIPTNPSSVFALPGFGIYSIVLILFGVFGVLFN